MPIYEYECENCNERFEKLIFGNDVPICPKCNSDNVKKLLSMCGFFKKGEGGELQSSSPSACTGCSATSCAGCSSGN